MAGLTDTQVATDFATSRAQAARGAPAANLDALLGSAKSASAAAATPAASPAPGLAGAPLGPPTPAPAPDLPIGLKTDQAARAVVAPTNTGLFGAFTAGAAQSLRDLESAGSAMAKGGASEEAPAADFAEPLKWGDLASPGVALKKAVYQIGHGAPVLAAGIAGGVAGAAVPGGGETGITELAGGALGAGAMTAAQTIGPYYAAALRANPEDHDGAFDQALKKAGTDGLFSAAGWALFGLKPFQGAVKNLLFQAFGAQPAVAVGQRATENLEEGRPASEGVLDAVPGAVVGTVLPAAGMAAIGRITGAGRSTADITVGGEGGAGAPANEGGVANEGEQANPPAPEESAAGAAATEPSAEKPTAEAPPEAAEGAQEGGAAPRAAAEEPAIPEAPGAAPAPFRIAGQAGDTAAVTPELRAQATDYIHGVTGDNPVQASLEQIADPSVMQKAISGVASFIPKDEVRTDEVTRAAAYATAMQPGDIMAGLRGTLPDDRAVAAWTMLVNSGAQQLHALAQRANESGAPGDWQAFFQAYALQNHILGEWTSTGSEQGRAFRARQIAWGMRSDLATTIQEMIAHAGPQDMEQVGRKIAALQTPEQASGLTGALRWMGSRDGLLYGWYNFLLGPKTVVKKAATDLLMPIWNLATRYTAETMGSGAIAPGETTALLHGYIGAFSDALQAGKRGLLAGKSQFASDYQTMDGIASTRTSLLANGVPEMLSPDEPTSAAIHYLKAALPTSWIAGVDDFAKVWNYRAELRALAYRQGVGRGLDGAELGEHINETVRNAPEDLHQQAVTQTLRTTFQEPLTGAAEALNNWADQFNIPIRGTQVQIPAGRILMPFFKVPANFVRFMYRQSPLPLVSPSESFRAETMFPGAARDLAYAKVGLGTALSLAAGGLAMGGYITGSGPSDPNLRKAWLAAGNEPYSVQVPGRAAINYPIEPFGQHIGAIADTIDLMKFRKQQDWDQAALSLALGVGHAFLSRTFMSGIADFMDAVQNPDKQGDRWADNLVASLTVPRIVSDTAGAMDPQLRAHYDLLHTLEARIPGASKGLPPQRDQWGDPIPLRDSYIPFFGTGAAAHMLSPLTLGPDPDKVQPIDKWIWDHRADFPASDEGRIGFTKPGQAQSYDAPGTRGITAHVQLTPQQLDRLQELTGNGVKDPSTGLGARDTLNALVQGKHPDAQMQGQWDQASDGSRAIQALTVYDKSKTAAKRQLLGEYSDLGEAVKAQWDSKAQALSGGGGSGGGAVAMPKLGGGS